MAKANKTTNETVNNVNQEAQNASASNTTQATQQNENKRISRSEFIKRRIENKKRAIDLNTNAQVFVSDSIAGTEIFSDLRMLDAMDSSIRKLWGNGIESKDAQEWVNKITTVKDSINDLQALGKTILVKVGNTRHISNNVLRRTILKEIEKQAQGAKE